MGLAAHYRSLAGYNRWMNERLYEAAARLDDGERKRDVGAFFRSLHGTLNHILLCDRAWLGRFTRDLALATSHDAAGNTIPWTGKLDQELYADFALLRRERGITDAAIERWAATLDDHRLEQPLAYRTTSGRDVEHPMWWAVSHFFNHQTHHRGQVTTLLTQAGHDPGVTDLIAYIRDTPPSRGSGR
jgi:uncharacterized damage-inducible protein DinB